MMCFFQRFVHDFYMKTPFSSIIITKDMFIQSFPLHPFNEFPCNKQLRIRATLVGEPSDGRLKTRNHLPGQTQRRFLEIEPLVDMI